MAFDLSKIKGISNEVKAKLAKVTNKEELDAVLKAENLTEEQLKIMAGGAQCESWCPGDGQIPCLELYCFGEGCKTLPW